MVAVVVVGRGAGGDAQGGIDGCALDQGRANLAVVGREDSDDLGTVVEVVDGLPVDGLGETTAQGTVGEAQGPDQLILAVVALHLEQLVALVPGVDLAAVVHQARLLGEVAGLAVGVGMGGVLYQSVVGRGIGGAVIEDIAARELLGSDPDFLNSGFIEMDHRSISQAILDPGVEELQSIEGVLVEVDD